MATVTREQLLNLDAESITELLKILPAEYEDGIILVMAGLYQSNEIEIPDEYLPDTLK